MTLYVIVAQIDVMSLSCQRTRVQIEDFFRIEIAKNIRKTTVQVH